MPFRPYDAGTDGIERARQMLAASRVDALSTSVKSDLRRLSIVMAVSAIDTYMHRLIVDRAYGHEKLPAGLARLDVPFERLLGQADEAAAAARAQPHNSRPRVGVKRDLRNRLLFETFQSFRGVSEALAMAGRPKNWADIGAAMTPMLTADAIRERLDSIVQRRNQIAHEGDYRRLERPQDNQRNSITHREAQDDVEFLARLIDAIHSAG
jgi:hypothetical protein